MRKRKYRRERVARLKYYFRRGPLTSGSLRSRFGPHYRTALPVRGFRRANERVTPTSWHTIQLHEGISGVSFNIAAQDLTSYDLSVVKHENEALARALPHFRVPGPGG